VAKIGVKKNFSLLNDNHFTIVLSTPIHHDYYFCGVKLRLLKILSLILCMAFFADLVEGHLYDSDYSVEMAEKVVTEKSEKDVEKDFSKDKFFHHTSSPVPGIITSHFIKNVPFKYSAYLSLPELPPEMS
jgi:hypothetical protein